MQGSTVNQTQPIFDPNDKLIKSEWEKINLNQQIKVISEDQLASFVQNVFQASKDVLEIELDPDTDYRGVVDQYLEQNRQESKKLFSYEQAVKVLNWAVQPQYQEQQNQQQQPNTNTQNQKSHQKSSQKVLNSKENHQQKPQKPQKQKKTQLKENKSTLIQNSSSIMKNQSKDHTKNKQTSLKKQQNDKEVKQKIGYQQKPLAQNKNIHVALKQNSRHNQNYLDWGEVYDEDKRKAKLYKSINSFRPTQKIQIFQNHQQIVTYPNLKQPISIKKSLAKINKHKSKPQINQQKLLNLVLNDPKSPQVKYIKKQKIVFKSKKPKQFKPDIMGLKQLFKFYCALHSQHSNKKPKDSVKGTFQHIKSNIQQLYMHNFMLLCKDFSILESRRIQNGVRINVSTVNESEDNERQEQNGEKDNRQTIGQDSTLRKARVQKNLRRRRNNADENSDIWDRDRLCGCFKRQADYRLNVKYDLFVEIMKQVLRNRITVETQAQEVFDQGGGDDEQQNNEASHRIDPYVLGLCKFFKVDTEQNFKQTMIRIKILYKMMDPEYSTSKQQKKLNGELNGHFKQHIHQNLKIRQLQKQKQRVQIKQKYFNKYSSTNDDIYSSFKAAKNQTNSSNAIYGSAPKLSPLNLSPSNQKNTKRLDSDLSQLRKNISKNYNSTSNICSILKQARRQIQQEKQNPFLNSKQPTSRVPKSRFNPFQTQKYKITQKILHQQKQPNQQEKTLSSILANKSRLMGQHETQRTRKIKNKSKDINSPLLQRFGCNEQDDLLDKYFDQQKHMLHPID